MRMASFPPLGQPPPQAAPELPGPPPRQGSPARQRPAPAQRYSSPPQQRRASPPRLAPPGGHWFQHQNPPDDAFPAEFRDEAFRLEERLAAARGANLPAGSLDPHGVTYGRGMVMRTQYSYDYDTIVEVAPGTYTWRGQMMTEAESHALVARWEADYPLVDEGVKESRKVKDTVTKDPAVRSMVFDDLAVDPDLQDSRSQIPPELLGPPLRLCVDRYGNIISDGCDNFALCYFEVDHIWPHSRRGLSVPGNLHAVFWLTNRIKSDSIHNSFVRRAADSHLVQRRRVANKGPSQTARSTPMPELFSQHSLQAGVSVALLQDLWAARTRGSHGGAAATGAAADLDGRHGGLSERDKRFIDLLDFLLRRNWLRFAGNAPSDAVLKGLLNGSAVSLLQTFLSSVGNITNFHNLAQDIVDDHRHAAASLPSIQPAPPAILSDQASARPSVRWRADPTPSDTRILAVSAMQDAQQWRADPTPSDHQHQPYLSQYARPADGALPAFSQPRKISRYQAVSAVPIIMYGDVPEVPPPGSAAAERTARWRKTLQVGYWGHYSGRRPQTEQTYGHLWPPAPEQTYPYPPREPHWVAPWRSPLNPLRPLPPLPFLQAKDGSSLVPVFPLPPWDPDAVHPEQWVTAPEPRASWWRRVFLCGRGGARRPPMTLEVARGEQYKTFLAAARGAAPADRRVEAGG